MAALGDLKQVASVRWLGRMRGGTGAMAYVRIGSELGNLPEEKHAFKKRAVAQKISRSFPGPPRLFAGSRFPPLAAPPRQRRAHSNSLAQPREAILTSFFQSANSVLGEVTSIAPRDVSVESWIPTAGHSGTPVADALAKPPGNKGDEKGIAITRTHEYPQKLQHYVCRQEEK